MKCPVCGAWVAVKETRARPANTVHRRYECANGHRFVTSEAVVRVIKPKEKTNDQDNHIQGRDSKPHK